MKTKNKHVISQEILEKLSDSCLFYPCSGKDMQTPIKLFSPFVTDFIFVDKGYFRPGDQDTRHWNLDKSANKATAVLEFDPDYGLMDRIIDGEPSSRCFDWAAPPCQLTEVYLHIPSGRTVRIHRIRDQGLLALHAVLKPIGVFFYRGDSQGEGGSGDYWLSAPFFDPVLSLMKDGGLVVTDGSNISPRPDTFSSLRRPSRQTTIRGTFGHDLALLQQVEEPRQTFAWQVRDLAAADPLIAMNRHDAIVHARDHLSRRDCWGHTRPRPEQPRQPIRLGQAIPNQAIILQAAQQGDPMSQTQLGLLCFHQGDASEEPSRTALLWPKDHAGSALVWFERAAAQNYAPAWFHLAHLLEHGLENFPARPEQALKYWMRLADSGLAWAQYHCFEMLRAGVIPENDLTFSLENLDERALGYCKMAAKQKHTHALLEMGRCCENGFASQAINICEAIEWYEQLSRNFSKKAYLHIHRLQANQGDPASQFRLGNFYQTGDGVKKDLGLAEHWHAKAAAQGDAEARFHLGLLLIELGRIAVASGHQEKALNSETRALDYLREGAIAGEMKSITQLSKISLERYQNAFRQNHMAQVALKLMEDEALHWLKVAPNHHSEEAKWALVEHFSESVMGQPRNLEQANLWLERIDTEKSLNRLAQFQVNRFLTSELISPEAFIKAMQTCAQLGKRCAKRARLMRRPLLRYLLDQDPQLLHPYLLRIYVDHARGKIPRQDPLIALKLARLWDQNGALPRDEEAAVYWYRRAAHRGNSDAQYALGRLYTAGRGVQVNSGTALSWHHQAAKQGHSAAFQVLHQAAKEGNRYAQRALHKMG